MKDVDLLCGGDLLNQLLSSHYVARDFHRPFLGMYAACATSSALIGQAAIWVEHGYAQYALAFTSSHVATAERQFRYPNEYGIQKKETTCLELVYNDYIKKFDTNNFKELSKKIIFILIKTKKVFILTIILMLLGEKHNENNK